MKTSRDPSELQKYLSDESRMPGGAADEVLWPETAAEVSEALAEFDAHGVPVTVSGGGTGVAGGRVPKGGVVLATDRLHGVRDLRVAPDRSRGSMCVGAGVPLADVQAAAAAEGLWYPPDPTENGCFVGGSIATNASGARTFRFGATRRWVTRLLVALADGTLLDLPRGAVRAVGDTILVPHGSAGPIAVPAPDWTLPRTTKHAAGYYSAPGMDLVDLFIGSEGTLGVVLEAELELIRAPEAMLSGILFFEDEAAALRFVADARGDRTSGAHGVTPIALEFFDGAALALLGEQGAPVPRTAATAIFFEQPVYHGAEYDAQLEAWGLLAEERNALAESWLAQEPAEQQRFREFRHAVPWTINERIARRGVRKVSTDTAVPTGRAPEMLAAFRRLLEPAGLESIAFGHIGDDHLHVNVLPSGPEQLDAAKALYRELVRAAIELGGTLSAEHGLGKLKGQDLPLLYSPAVIERMRTIKRALDPRGVLGQGTLFAS